MCTNMGEELASIEKFSESVVNECFFTKLLEMLAFQMTRQNTSFHCYAIK